MSSLTQKDLFAMETTWWQRLGVAIFGCIKYERRLDIHYDPEWIYLAKCKRHGFFTDSLHGFKEHMNCPDCLRERNETV